MSEIKQMLVIRGDLVKKMKSGKLAVQLSHASNAFMAWKWLSGLEPSENERKWLSDDLSVKNGGCCSGGAFDPLCLLEVRHFCSG